MDKRLFFKNESSESVNKLNFQDRTGMQGQEFKGRPRKGTKKTTHRKNISNSVRNSKWIKNIEG